MRRRRKRSRLLLRPARSARYPGGVPERTRDALAHELKLIAALDYAPYFLTVHDIVRFARSKGILCQGRGSAANSAVCYCLGITEVDPARFDLLFERFISPERNEPPDIDVDFEHERREEVIQYIYERYGRERASLAAAVITYRTRSAIRETAKVFGLSDDVVAALNGTAWGQETGPVGGTRVRAAGLDPADPTLRLALTMAQELIGFPRHLTQHSGGFVITRDRLDEVAPVMNTAMDKRTMVEWDKDDLDALGLLKVDVLALGMLTALSKGLRSSRPALWRAVHSGNHSSRGGVRLCDDRARRHDRRVPDRKPRADVDAAAAQARELLRSRHRGRDRAPRSDPGRHGASLFAPPAGPRGGLLSLEGARGGVEEDARRAAVPGAGDEDRHRRRRLHALGSRQIAPRYGDVPSRRNDPDLQEKMVEGMAANGYDREFAERCFHQIEGFGEYGFPESHAASFALLVYDSCWMKCRYPDVFAAAMLNAQPLGFYAPAQLVRDAREHGVEVREVDVNLSDWDCTLEPFPPLPKGRSEERPSLDGLRGEGLG